MIKRIIGLLVAAAVIAVIVFAVMHHGKYRSMLKWQAPRQTVAPATRATSATRGPGQVSTPAADSLALGRE